mgnify:FL=1
MEREFSELKVAHFLLSTLTLGALALLHTTANAQTYPTKPIRNVVPWPPGAPLDTIARALSNEISKRWNQPIVVENRAGAASIIGAEQIGRAHV